MNDHYQKYLSSSTLSRSEMLGRYIVDTKSTVRGAAKVFGISKSTVHKDLRKVLKQENISLYEEVCKVLQTNKEERHIRGGLATKDKYQIIKNLKEHNRGKI